MPLRCPSFLLGCRNKFQWLRRLYILGPKQNKLISIIHSIRVDGNRDLVFVCDLHVRFLTFTSGPKVPKRHHTP